MIKNLLHRFALRDKLLALIVPLLVLTLWQSVLSLHLFSELILIPPLTLVSTFIELASSGDLTNNILASLQRVITGFLVGGSLGFILGVVTGLSPFMNRVLKPLIKALQQVPEFAWMPLIILLFGIDELAKVVFVAIGAFYPMLFNTYQGVSGVPKKYQELAWVFDYRRFSYLTKVVIPSALPSIITGIRLSLGLSWMFVVGAELFGADAGLGYMMTWGRQLFQIDIVMVGLIVIGAIGLVMNSLLLIIEKRLLSWRIAFDGRTL
ncbi:MAG: ABC transporter permease [Chlorobiaceae bacterium]|nr:ABC transporter permease [Chlorobiaceae bacterium]